MVATRKRFRIESFLDEAEPADGPGNGSGGGNADFRHQQILREIGEVRKLIKPTQEISGSVLSDYKQELREALKLKTELEEMYEAINKTKTEIATLHHSGFEGEQMLRVTDELDAIVIGTEQATETILHAAETIDDKAGVLTAQLTGNQADTVSEISDSVVGIFEACNFQDLTGQRISKVVGTLKFIEERIVRMMEIWGGIDAFDGLNIDSMPVAEGDAALLNGPALETDQNIASQDDIDALFA